MTDGGEMGADVSVVACVEQGKAPDSVTAKARGAGPNVVNTELPAAGQPTAPGGCARTRRWRATTGRGMWRVRAVLAVSDGG